MAARGRTRELANTMTRQSDFPRLEQMEADYAAKLRTALKACAAGSWGLFGHNERNGDVRHRPAIVDKLLTEGEAINRKRVKLGLPPYTLHEEFVSVRGPKDPNAPGEPKVALTWLGKLGE